MFPSPGRAALGHGSATTAGGGGMASTAASTRTTTMAFCNFPPPPSDSPTTAAAHISHHHHGLLGYSPLAVLDHPTTTTTSSSSIAIPSATPNLHAPPSVLRPLRSSPPPHPWSCGEGDRERQRGKSAMTGMGVVSSGAAGKNDMGVGAVRMKKAAAAGGGGAGLKAKGARRKVREPRFCFKTMSDVDVLDDGYKWRKYGQKVVKNTHHPRSYYRCTQDKCRVKKRVERLAEDPRMVITTYEGRHVHSPSRDDDDAARAKAEMTFIW